MREHIDRGLLFLGERRREFAAGTKLSSYPYTLGNAGNRANVLDLNNRNVAYGYDNDYQLGSEAITADPAGNNGTVNYVYDVVGNRASMTSTLNAVPGGSFFFDNNDRLTTDIYDANGNTTSSAGISNTYDFENRMLTHGALSLVYDGDGNRVSETVGGTTTKYLVDDLNPTQFPQVLDELVNGSVTRTYAYGLQRLSEDQQINGTWIPSFYGYDGHGNVRFLTNAAGTVTDSYDFDAFGMPIRTSGITPNQFLYGGERSDSSVGLYDLRARYYDQATGRFWARDAVEGYPCQPATLYPYVYVADDPVDKVDPLGLATITLPLPTAPTAPAPPTQPQARPGGGALAEYILVVAIVGFSAIAGSERLAEAINCGFQWVSTGVGASVASNLPPAKGGPCKQKPTPSCATDPLLSQLVRCDSLPPNYKYHDLAQALGAIWGYWGRPVRTKNGVPANNPNQIPCVGKGGMHYSLRFGYPPNKPYAGSVGCCPCCNDDGGLPHKEDRCACLNVDHKPCPF